MSESKHTPGEWDFGSDLPAAEFVRRLRRAALAKARGEHQ